MCSVKFFVVVFIWSTMIHNTGVFLFLLCNHFCLVLHSLPNMKRSCCFCVHGSHLGWDTGFWRSIPGQTRARKCLTCSLLYQTVIKLLKINGVIVYNLPWSPMRVLCPLAIITWFHPQAFSCILPLFPWEGRFVSQFLCSVVFV